MKKVGCLICDYRGRDANISASYEYVICQVEDKNKLSNVTLLTQDTNSFDTRDINDIDKDCSFHCSKM